MIEPHDTFADPNIRDAIPGDQPEVLRLFHIGSLDPDAPELHDPPNDIYDFQTAWLDNDAANLWVLDGDADALVGMVGVRERNEGTAELCRLRVDPGYRNKGVGRRLVQHAVEYCRTRDYLKVILDSYVQRTSAIALFEHLGFRPAGEHVKAGKRVMDFYLDLYSGPT